MSVSKFHLDHKAIGLMTDSGILSRFRHIQLIVQSEKKNFIFSDSFFTLRLAKFDDDNPG